MPPAPTPTPHDAIVQPPPNAGAITMEPEEGGGGWYIPRPALCRNDMTCTCSSSTQRSIQTVNEWLSPSPSSNTSTQVFNTTWHNRGVHCCSSAASLHYLVSGSSGSLLLTAANLAGLRLEPARKDPDVCSIASSTHFTMVNYGNTRAKERKQSCCAKHTVSALVLTVCALFLAGLIVAIYYLDMRARSVKYSR